jgi:hypothetical protein
MGVKSVYQRDTEATAPNDEELLDVDLSTSTGGWPLHRSSRRLFPGATTTTTGDDDVDGDGGGDDHGDCGNDVDGEAMSTHQAPRAPQLRISPTSVGPRRCTTCRSPTDAR